MYFHLFVSTVLTIEYCQTILKAHVNSEVHMHVSEGKATKLTSQPIAIYGNLSDGIYRLMIVLTAEISRSKYPVKYMD